MQKYSKDFTLIELLVVVGIIAILASLLLPALKNAKFMAVRTLCLGERKQNYLSVDSFAMDHDDLVPYSINGWSAGKRAHSGISSYHNASMLLMQHSYYIDNKNPFGTLVAKGYVQNPSIMYCPAFLKDMRTKSQNGDNINVTSYFDLPQNAGSWKRMTNWNQNSMWRGQMFGITHYFHRLRYGGTLRTPTRLRFFAEEWNQLSKNIHTSPMIMSCGNYRCQDKMMPFNQSHQHRGINGIFFDGSARWIDVREYDPTGTIRATKGLNFFTNDSGGYPYDWGVQLWARKKLKFGS